MAWACGHCLGGLTWPCFKQWVTIPAWDQKIGVGKGPQSPLTGNRLRAVALEQTPRSKLGLQIHGPFPSAEVQTEKES